MARPEIHKVVDKYIKLCEEEARALTGIEFCARDSKSRPTLDFHFQQSTGWTFERLVQVFFVHQFMDVHIYAYLLIDLYHAEPIHLYRQFETARRLCRYKRFSVENFDRSKEIERLLRRFPTRLTPALKMPQLRRFLEALLPIEEGMETIFERLAIETAGLVLNRIGKSKAFEMYINDEWYPEDFQLGTGGSTPFLTGFYFIISGQLSKFQTNVIEYIKSMPRPRHGNRLAKPGFQGDLGRQFDGKSIQLAFAPSGSGKTTSIFDELTRHYGYYMVSCALPRHQDIQAGHVVNASSRDLSGTIMDPKALQGVSEDTRELLTMLKYVKSLDTDTCSFEASDLFKASTIWWERIIKTRHRIFHWFREALASDSTPTLWLSFQLDCSEWDPFLHIFRLTSLFPTLGLNIFAETQIPQPPHYDPTPYHDLKQYHNSIVSTCLSDIDKDVHWACIDEAQEDLQATIQDSNLLAACMSAISKLEIEQDDFIYFRQVIFAGTSLNVTKALKTREKLLETNKFYRGAVWDEKACNMATQFPLVVNTNAAEAVLKTYFLNDTTSAVDQSEPLRGRVKWTAMYAEKIVEEVKKGETKDFDALSKEDYEKAIKELFAMKREELNFKTLAEETHQNIVENLSAKLGVLQKREDCGDLLDKLLEAAISADILGRPHVFYQESDMELVEQGFAIVDSRMSQLEFKLKKNFTVIGKTNKKLIAKLEKDQPVEDCTIDLLAEVDKDGFILMDCTIDKLTVKMVDDGFTIVDCTMDKLATELEGEGFTIIKKSKDELTAKSAKGGSKTNDRIDQLAKRMKNSFTVKDCVKDKLTTEMVKQGFTIWGGDKREQLRTLLRKYDIIIDKETNNQLTARLKEGFAIDDLKLGKLGAELLKKGFIIVDKTIDQLTELAESGFRIRGPHKNTQLRAHIRGRLSGQGFSVLQETENQLRVKLKQGCAIEVGMRDELAASLRSCGFKIVNKTINELHELVKEPFTVINSTKNELTAKLAERVVIDAIILLSIGHRYLDEKLMTLVRLVSTRTGLGHPAEHYLAVQLRQYLSKPIGYDKLPSRKGNDSHSISLRKEWAEKQSRVLACLAKAENCDNLKFGSLNNFTLAVGDQTVKKFDGWQGWVNGFLVWLHALQNGHKPCASFLIPHNDFGPDLVFAVRKKEGGKEMIVLCSIQLKLGWASVDAVNKSSILWACGDRKVGTEGEETKRLEAAKKKKEENERRRVKLKEEAQKLERMKKKMEAEEQELKKMVYGEDGEHLYSEMLKMVNERFKKTSNELRDMSKKLDEPEDSSKETEDSISRDLLEVKELLEDAFWRDQFRLSLLIATGAQTQRHLGEARPNASHGDERREYFAFIGAEDTNALFGTPFETMLGVIPD